MVGLGGVSGWAVQGNGFGLTGSKVWGMFDNGV